MKVKDRGFTLIELLVVLAIIGMLVSILIPSLKTVRNKVKETSQRSQFAAIEQALIAFKADYGSYPPSDWHPVTSPDYCGAQKLAEALIGWDKLGFDPDSQWRAIPGLDAQGNQIYDPANLQDRKGPYLESEAVDVFNLGEVGLAAGDGLYVNLAASSPLRADRFVFTDVFKIRPVVNPNTFERVKAGSPILYYRANTSSKTINSQLVTDFRYLIYDVRDNQRLVELNRLQKDGVVSTDPADVHPLGNVGSNDYPVFYNFEKFGGIRDPKTTANIWQPYRPDSFILISAGADGLYGTRDDITNF